MAAGIKAARRGSRAARARGAARRGGVAAAGLYRETLALAACGGAWQARCGQRGSEARKGRPRWLAPVTGGGAAAKSARGETLGACALVSAGNEMAVMA